MGATESIPHDLRYDRSDEFMEIVLGHWNSWQKDALIVDVRYNGGGFIPDFFMNILRQKLVNLWKPRYGQDWRDFNVHCALVKKARKFSSSTAPNERPMRSRYGRTGYEYRWTRPRDGGPRRTGSNSA